MPSKHIRSITPPQVVGGGGTTTIEAFTDTFTLQINTPDSVTAPTDSPTFVINAAYSDTQTSPTDEVSVGIQGLGDTFTAPTDARTALLRAWLSGSAGAGVGTPTNADGVNDTTLATITTAPAGAATETMTSAMGAGIPGGITFSAATYTGWFRAQTTLPTSTARVVARSIGALFADVTMFTQSTAAGDTTFLVTPLSFDLVAAGINTLAELQSLQIIHETTDAVAGVSPAILTVDAGAVDIVITSI